MNSPLLSVKDLRVAFKTKKGMAEAVRGVDFKVERGETLAIVGESGSGKSVGALAILGLLPSSAKISGSIMFDGEELLGQSSKQLRTLRGRRISMIFQDPMTAFNPVHTIGAQIIETLQAHASVTKVDAKRQATDLLELVGINEPSRRVDQYPFEFSGGMRQRAMIALAIANKPDLIIADEPTTALDVTIQAQIMETLSAMRDEVGAGMILITHDLGLVAGFADRVQVTYGGRVFERAETPVMYYESVNPYTKGLLASMPRLDADSGRLIPIVGSPPSLLNMPTGCAFAPRCPHQIDICHSAPAALEEVSAGHESRCYRTSELVSKELR